MSIVSAMFECIFMNNAIHYCVTIHFPVNLVYLSLLFYECLFLVYSPGLLIRFLVLPMIIFILLLAELAKLARVFLLFDFLRFLSFIFSFPILHPFIVHSRHIYRVTSLTIVHLVQ